LSAICFKYNSRSAGSMLSCWSELNNLITFNSQRPGLCMRSQCLWYSIDIKTLPVGFKVITSIIWKSYHLNISQP
jgi:hypothetical protein